MGDKILQRGPTQYFGPGVHISWGSKYSITGPRPSQIPAVPCYLDRKRLRYSNRTVKYSIKQPVGQVVPCQLTQSSYATNYNAIKYFRGSTQSAAIFEISSAQVYIYTHTV